MKEDRIAAVVFDYGNVLSLTPEPADYHELQRLAQLEEKAFLLLYWRYRLDYDRNVLDAPGYWRRIAQENGREFSAAQIQHLIATDIALWTRTNASMLAWVSVLRVGGVKTAVLSNMPVNFSAYLRTSADWMQHFDHHVFSGELGLLKPDPAIYRACLEGLQVKPEETLFIDDRPVNVEGAQAMGMHGVVFETLPQLSSEVQRFGLPALLAQARLNSQLAPQAGQNPGDDDSEASPECSRQD